jgi:hypothetical protein
MPFILIQGTFHLVGQTQAGNPTGFEPDGDSIQFKPASPQLLDRLTQLARPYRLTSIGSTQLRFEGIDALELHFDSTHQPRPLADPARDFLTGELHLNPVAYRPPRNLQVSPPSPTMPPPAGSCRDPLRSTAGRWRLRSPAALAGRDRGLPTRGAAQTQPELPVAGSRARLPVVLRHAVCRAPPDADPSATPSLLRSLLRQHLGRWLPFPFIPSG